MACRHVCKKLFSKNRRHSGDSICSCKQLEATAAEAGTGKKALALGGTTLDSLHHNTAMDK